MSPPVEPAKAAAETHLQRTLTSVLNGLPADAALVAIFHQEHGPLTTQVHRGFTPRDVQSIGRTLSSQKVGSVESRSISAMRLFLRSTSKRPPKAAEPRLEIVQLVRQQIGAVASMRNVMVVQRLPKTRSGKILRKLLRSIIDKAEFQIPSTIDDEAIIGEIQEAFESYVSLKAK